MVLDKLDVFLYQKYQNLNHLNFNTQTYFGVDVSAIKDDIHRRALETMIETYGQTPLQLFPNPHSKRFSKAPSSLMEMLPQTMENMILNLPKEKESQQSPSPLKTDQLLLPEGKCCVEC